VDTGLSQTSRRLAHFEEGVVWNFPIDITFKSTNVFGWPRIAVSVNGIDFLGRDVVLGYGSALIPLSVGHHIIDMDIYAPLAVSSFNQFMSWLMGNPPEVSMESLRGLL
jgi:B9 domain-containing protein 1